MVTVSDRRAFIRSQIRPLSQVQTYQTGWGGYMTFAQIIESLTPLSVSLLCRWEHAYFNEIPDALQRGFMVLWERLVRNNNLLMHLDKYKAATIVSNNCGMGIEKRQKGWQCSFEELTTNSNGANTDEWFVTGLEHHRSEVWAAWASGTDMRIDIEHIMNNLATDYLRRPAPHGDRYLIALYYITTQVTLEDAAQIAGINHHYLLDNYANGVKQDVMKAFGDIYRPGIRWIEKFKRGNIIPAQKVLNKYQHNPNMVAAIHSLLEEQSSQPSPSVKAYHRMRARRALEQAYHCAA